MKQHAALLDALQRRSIDGDGKVPAELRRAASEPGAAGAPAAIRAILAKIDTAAYKITDEDIAALKAAGYDEDQIFELTLAVAIGAGARRQAAALRACGIK
jgi:hypothetical protein